jgi:hypothetical protein
MNYRKIFLGTLVTCSVLSSQAAVASQASMRPEAGSSQAGQPQAGVPHHHQGALHHPGANQEEYVGVRPGTHTGTHTGTHPGTHTGTHTGTHPGNHPGTHSGNHPSEKGASEEKEITPVKKELIDALKNQKESSLHCTAGSGKNHPLTPAVIEEKATKVKKKAGNFVVTLSSGDQVTCAK